MLQRAEDVFDSASSDGHCIRLPVESTLHNFQYMFVLPSSDAAIVAGRTSLLEMATRACAAQTRPGCHRLIVTDGLRYGVYTRPGDGEFRLYAYFNLIRLRKDYPVYPCKGAREALVALAPEWKPGAELAIIEPVLQAA
ncbi:hypothetical protein P3T40_007382 [Paraburkholderia sp. EB58]|jgi:hypothetical protein